MKLTITIDPAGGTVVELLGNHLGTIAGQVVPAGGEPPKGAPRRNQPHPVAGTASNLHGLSDAELLDCLGPSWAAMTPEARDAYGPRNPPRQIRDAA